VTNQGNLDAEASSYTITFRPLGSHDRIEVASGEIPAIATGGFAWIDAYNVTAVIQAEYPELLGRKGFFELTVDSDDILAELDETNNVVDKPVLLPVIKPDFSVSNLQVSQGAVLDGEYPVEVSFDYDIQKYKAAYDGITYSVVARPQDGSGQAIVLETATIFPEAANETGHISLGDVYPLLEGANAPFGTNFVFEVVIDHEDSVSETDETNNTATTTLHLQKVITDAYVTSANYVAEDDSFVFVASLGGSNNLSDPLTYSIKATNLSDGSIYDLAEGVTTVDEGGESQFIEIEDLTDLLLQHTSLGDGPEIVLTAIVDPADVLEELAEFNNSGSDLFEF